MDLLLPTLSTISQTVPTVPYPMNILRQRKWLPFVRTNGYANLAKRLMVKVVSDIATAEELWKLFSPNETFFDLWDVRKAFFQSFSTQPYFLTLFEKGQEEDSILGVLPLWLDDDEFKGDYSWYGGYWPEGNTFFAKDLDAIPLLLMAAPKPLNLSCIQPLADYDFLSDLPGFDLETDKKYLLSVDKYDGIENYLMHLKKKKRQNLRRDRKRILAHNPRIIVNDFYHLEDLFRLNIDRFKIPANGHPASSDSIYEDPRHQELFRYLAASSNKYETRIIATEIEGKIEAVEVGFIYNNVFYSVSSGANIVDYSGLGVFSNLLVIEEAMKSRCAKIDFLEGDYNWKNSWDLESYHEYKFTK